jgi:alpha-tubulin suppressor-like RCC1 family protein
MANGTAYCWGDNEYGELGDGTYTQQDTPVLVKEF